MNIQELREEISKVNADHWTSDYNDAALPGDHTLIRRLSKRITPLLRQSLRAGLVSSCECGPCGKYGFKINF